jgi:hypothetical protein
MINQKRATYRQMGEYVIIDEYIGHAVYVRDVTAGCMVYRSLSHGTQGL